MPCCSPTDWADIYYTVYNFELYVFPLAIIVATHLKIYLLLKRYVSLTVRGERYIETIVSLDQWSITIENH